MNTRPIWGGVDWYGCDDDLIWERMDAPLPASADLPGQLADRQRPVDLYGADLEVYDSSRLAREESSAGRLSAHVARARTARSRAGTADERDAIASGRDETARRRDVREEAAERAIAVSDISLAEKLQQVRSRASAARGRASADRERAAQDRADGARDRARLVERSIQLTKQGALISETIRDLRPGDTPEATGQAICRRVVNLTGVAVAQLLLFEINGHAWPIGFVVKGQPDSPLRRLPFQRSRHLRERAAEGPWIEAWVTRPWHPYNQLLNGLGIHAVAYAPVRHEQQLIGLLLICTKGSVEEPIIAEALSALVEFADLSGALIGRDVAERTEVGRGRDHILGIIAHRAFGPVFQPIVDLASNHIVGYEALTRFTDGADPEVVFADAAVVGLGVDLETVTLGAALAAAQALPSSAWLDLNASPELILAEEPLRTILAGRRRHLVLEVTEHTAIADYPGFRAAMAALLPRMKFAVDDAGVGFASLRHILELRPAFVKLDRWLVTDIESDEARQAMIVGLRHFAQATRCRLIAEGIETEDQLAALKLFKVELGQGYLLGRPQPVDAFGLGSARLGTAKLVKREPPQKPASP